MGRARRPLAPGTPPAGPRWAAFRRQLFTWDHGGWGPAPACFYCSHVVNGPGAGEVDHRISWQRRPDLAWSVFWRGERFLVPCHSGKHPCPVCGLACNGVASGGVAPVDELGRHAGGWDEAFIRAAQARRRRRAGPSSRQREVPPKPAEVPAKPAKPRVFPGAGRPF